jgi:recombination protein RecA
MNKFKKVQTDTQKEALANSIKAIHKNLGKDSINFLGKMRQNVVALDTGSILINNAIGVGGIPLGKLVEIYGPESSGKTTLCLQIAAQTQKAGGTIAFIDQEHALNQKYAKDLGLDLNKMIFSQPDSAEDSLTQIETLVNSGSVDLIIVDSVAAMTTRAESEGDFGDAHVAQLPRLLSASLKKIVPIANTNKCTIIFINQIRDKIGVMGYGPKTITPGGHSLKFNASVRINIKRTGALKGVGTGPDIGNTVKIKVEKNKVAAPFKEASLELYFGEGISKEADILIIAEKDDSIGFLEKVGNTYHYSTDENCDNIKNTTKLGGTKTKARLFLKENPDLVKEITDRLELIEIVKNFKEMGNDIKDQLLFLKYFDKNEIDLILEKLTVSEKSTFEKDKKEFLSNLKGEDKEEFEDEIKEMKK